MSLPPGVRRCAAAAHRGWPLVGEPFWADADRDWEWEGILAGGRLHLFCYLRDTVVALAPFELEAQPADAFPI